MVVQYGTTIVNLIPWYNLVDEALLYTSPRVNQMALQIVQILDLCLLNYVLHNAPEGPDFVVDRVKVWAIRRN